MCSSGCNDHMKRLICLVLLTVGGGVFAQEQVLDPGAFAPRHFGISASGLVATVRKGTVVFGDGSAASVTGGSVQLLPNSTNFVMLDLRDLSLHAWRRAGDRGAVLVGTVVTGPTSVISISQPIEFKVPDSRLSRTRAALANNCSIKVLLIGDSLTAGAGASAGNAWYICLFDVAQAANTAYLGTNFSYVNTGLGGAVSRWGMAVLADVVGRPYGPDAVNAPGWATSRGAYKNSFATTPLANVGQPSGFLMPKPTLAIVCFGANAQYNSNEELGYLETIVRKLRREGCDVILWNGVWNNYNPSALTSKPGDYYLRIADRHGAEYIDTAARVDEYNRDASGTFVGNTYNDGVHQKDAGQQIIANAFKALFVRPQRVQVIPPNDYRLLINVQSNWFPNHADVEIGQAGAIVTPATTVAANNGYSIAIVSGGKSAASANLSLNPGTNVCYAFSRACAVDWFIYTTAPASFDLTQAGGGWSKTGIAVPSQSWGLVQAGMSYGDCVGNIFGSGAPGQNNWPLRNWCFNATVTAGTINADACIAYNFDGYSVPYSAMDFKGTWGEEDAAHDAAQRYKYSDDLGNASVTIPFTGNGLVVYIHSFTASGKIDTYVDGQQIHFAADTYNTGTYAFVTPLQFWPKNMTRTANFADNYGSHVAKIVLTSTVNGSAGAAAAQNRRLAVYEAFAVDAR